jgi:hypothetical protein
VLLLSLIHSSFSNQNNYQQFTRLRSSSRWNPSATAGSCVFLCMHVSVCVCVCRCVGVGVNSHLSRGSLQTPVGVQASRLPGGPAPPGGGAPGGPAPPGGGAAPPPGRPQVTFVVPFQVTILVALSLLPLHSLTLSIHFHRRLRLPSRLHHLLLLVRRSPRPLPRKLRRDRCTKRILCRCVRFRTITYAHAIHSHTAG